MKISELKRLRIGDVVRIRSGSDEGRTAIVEQCDPKWSVVVVQTPESMPFYDFSVSKVESYKNLVAITLSGPKPKRGRPKKL